MTRTMIAVAWIAVQLCYLCGWTVYEATRLLPGVGQSVLVRVVPLDPRDLLRGQYMRLGYEFSRLPSNLGAKPNDTVWIVLRSETVDGKQYYEPVDYSLDRPASTQEGDVVIRGRADRGNRVEFGIEKYFVPEGTETPNPRDISVRLRIGPDHRPRIETVYLKGVPWP